MSAVVWKNLSLLRGIAICLVVLNHSTKAAYGLRPAGADGALTWDAPIRTGFFILLFNVTPLCLPAFLVASGLFAYRWLRSWKSCLTNVRQLLRRYLPWAIVLYFVLIAFTQKTFDVQWIVWGIFEGGPLASYWFFALLIKLYLISPLLIRGIERWPRAVGIGALALQFLVCLRYYLHIQGYSVLFIIPEHGVLLHLPFYVMGMLISRNVSATLEAIARYRTLIAVSCLAALVAACAESAVIGMTDTWRTRRPPNAFAGERAFNIMFGCAAACLIIASRGTASSLRRWLDSVGMASLGVLLTTDLCLRAAFVLAWHVPSRLWALSHVQTFSGSAPAWLSDLSVGLVPIFFLVGILGPLCIMSATQKLAGARLYASLFGTGTLRRSPVGSPPVNNHVAKDNCPG